LRLSPADVVQLPLAAALFDRDGVLVAHTPEWNGARAAVSYVTGGGTLRVATEGADAGIDELCSDLVAQLRAATPGLLGGDRLAVEMLTAGLALVLARAVPEPGAGDTHSRFATYLEEGVRRSVAEVRLAVVDESREARVPAPAAVALATVQLVRNAAVHRQARDVRVCVQPGPTISVEWKDASARHSMPTSRRSDRRERWGAGYARLLADALGWVVTAPASSGDGVVASTIGGGVPRLSLPVAHVVHGVVQRATRAWDEETALPPGSPLDAQTTLAVSAAGERPGEIGTFDVFKSRAVSDGAWLAIPPEAGLLRVQDMVRGLAHENALLAAPEPFATRIRAIAMLLTTIALREPLPLVSPATWARDLPAACTALRVPLPGDLGANRLRFPEPSIVAYLLETLGGTLQERADGIVCIAVRPNGSASPIPRLLGAADGLLPLGG